ncbi:transglycosylase domain-containing protein [Exiguobacterium profundum]|uniref:transglycosylase domain-containing protein n=1 Tax=Exiguobacterium TaxID=33986 RepID=UPI001BECEE6C|nr:MULTISPECIES: transglycosylase domain-containing protein [Exiguobacterium]MCT4797716.1 transglycosylase domain-containing protein [Exiguobacterium profundum]MDT0191394.1 transglycosylase domain-containing protein [Exiguobacterium sp. BG5(2022)]
MERSRVARRQDSTTNKRKKTGKQPKTKSKKPMWKRIFLLGFMLFIAAVIAFGAYTVYAIATAPELDEDKLVDTYPIQLLSAEGEPLEGAGQIREYVSIDDISEVMQQAVVSIEDRRFYEHNGIDLRRIGGAVVANLTEGFGAEGGSTITQQLVKQSFLSTDKKLKRKLQEQWLALKLEREYTKEQILEMYLNKNYYGSGGYGVQTASKRYFNKPVSEVNYQEAAILAGLPQRPSAYDPINGDQELTRYRQEQVLSAMKRDGHISEEQYNEALDVAIADVISPGEETEEEAFTRAIYSRVLNELEEDYGLEQSDIYGTGLKVYTSINKELHTKINSDIKSNNVNLQTSSFPEDLRMGATVLNTKTGEIVAIVDSQQAKQGDTTYRDYSNEKYQIGSTAKPFFDYGPGIENGQWSTGKVLLDAKLDGTYSPNNYYSGFRGPNTMRQYLKISANTPAVRAFQEVRDEYGQEAIESFVKNVGIEPSYSGDELNESNALGTAEASTTQMAAAYATLGANGMYTKPHLIQKIEFNDGSSINSPIKAKQAMEDYTAYMLTDMLRDVVSAEGGTYVPGAFPWDVAGKTGTTNEPNSTNPKDKWFTGYSTDYSISVWTGKTKDSTVASFDPDYAQYYFEYMMQQVTNATGQPDRFQRPDSVLSLGNELYVKGTKPKDLQPEKLVAPTGASVNYDEEGQTGSVSWSYDFDGAQADGYTDITFTVTQKSADGSEQVVGTTGETSVNIANLAEGDTTFTIVANASNPLTGEQQSAPAQASYSIEPKEEPTEEEENPTDEGNSEDEPSDENNGNGNDNGNGNGNGDGNGEDTTDEQTPDEPATDEGSGEGTDEPTDGDDSGTPLEGQSNGESSDTNRGNNNSNNGNN